MDLKGLLKILRDFKKLKGFSGIFKDFQGFYEI